MHGDIFYAEGFLWPVLLVDSNGFHLGERRDAVVPNDLPEHGIHAIQMGRLVQENEELGAVCAWAFVGHGHHAASTVSQRRPDFVLKGTTPDGLAALGVFGGRIGGSTSLYHELGYRAVEG